MNAKNNSAHWFMPMRELGGKIYFGPLGRMGTIDLAGYQDPKGLADFIVASCNAAIAPPVAAGSVDAKELNSLLRFYASAVVKSRDGDQSEITGAKADLLEFYNSWGAQQREAGRQEVIGMQSEFLKKLHAAEARAAHLEHFFKHHSLQVPPQYTDLHSDGNSTPEQA